MFFSTSSSVDNPRPPVRAPDDTNSSYSLSISDARPPLALCPRRLRVMVRISSRTVEIGSRVLNAWPNDIFCILFTNASERSRIKLGTMNSGLNRVYRPPMNLLNPWAALMIPVATSRLVPFIAEASLGSVNSTKSGLPSSKTVSTFLSAFSYTGTFLDGTDFPCARSALADSEVSLTNFVSLILGLRTVAISPAVAGLSFISFTNAWLALLTCALRVAPIRLSTMFCDISLTSRSEPLALRIPDANVS